MVLRASIVGRARSTCGEPRRTTSRGRLSEATLPCDRFFLLSVVAGFMAKRISNRSFLRESGLVRRSTGTWSGEGGASLVEYALLVALIAIISVAGVASFGRKVHYVYDYQADYISGEMDNAGAGGGGGCGEGTCGP